MSWCSGSVLVLRLLISSDVSAAQLLHQDADDADEDNEVDLVEKHKTGRKSPVSKCLSSTPQRSNLEYVKS